VTRALKPRATDALALQPACVSDRTAPAVLGLEPRTFREWVAREGIPAARIGKRVVVRLQDALAALDRASGRAEGSPSPAPEETADADGVDRVLRLVGRTRRTP
jgi:hypothetical protein